MLTPQFTIPAHHELAIDLFAGGGGASTGMEQALGRPVDVAINHDPQAVALHQANHPQTLHLVSDVFEIDPVTVADGRPVGLLWASPDCTFHSKARGGKPHRDRKQANKRRALAGVVVRWAKAVRPRVICLENVEEFQHWGPLDASGQPCPRRRGSSFRRWVASLRNLGYVVEWRELRACDYGAPTIRKRLFLVARCDGAPIVWPAPTHGAPDSLPVRQRKLLPWRTAAECIDWSVPAPSIFERARPLADATCRRIAKGIVRYVIEAAEPFNALVQSFLVVYYGSEDDGQALSDPLRTVPTRDRFGLVMAKGQPYATADIGLRMLTPRELYRAQGFPADYIIERGADGRALTKTAQVRMCGNSVCPPMARALVAANYRELEARQMERMA